MPAKRRNAENGVVERILNDYNQASQGEWYGKICRTDFDPAPAFTALPEFLELSELLRGFPSRIRM
jgi:hypothetical protein